MAWVAGIGAGLVLLFVFPRQMGVLFALIVVGVGLIIGYLYWQDGQKRANLAKVTGAARLDPIQCTDPTYPLAVMIENRTGGSIDAVTFMIVGKRPGYSDKTYSSYSSSTLILGAGLSMTACYPLQGYALGSADPRALEWSIEPLSVTPSNQR